MKLPDPASYWADHQDRKNTINGQKQMNAQSSTQKILMAEQMDGYTDLFNIRGKGMDQLINEDDRNRLKAASAQINKYLEDVTAEAGSSSDEWCDKGGYLTTKLTHKIAEKLTEEMKRFSVRMIEKKKLQQIRDLTNSNILESQKKDATFI